MTAYEMRISDWSSDVCSSDLSAALSDLGSDHRRLAGIEDVAADHRRFGEGLSPPRLHVVGMIPERDAGRNLGAASVDLAGQFGGLGPGGGIVDLVGIYIQEPGELAPLPHFVGDVLNHATTGFRKI